MLQLLLLLPLQVPSPERLFEKPIDDTHVLSLLRNLAPKAVTIRLVVEEKADRSRSWELERLEPQYNYEFIRADRSSAVLLRTNDYGFDGTYVKFFFDLASKKVLKRAQYVETGLSQITDSEAQLALAVPAEFVSQLKTVFEPKPLPQELLATPLPQSTYAEFARARPARVRDGYGPGSSIRETIEPYQIAGNKIWFGKSFYDGEGITGVGAIGYFDRPTKKYTFLRIQEVADWSVSNLLVEGDTLWAGLVRHPEGADRPGGLIHHDLKSGVTKKFPVDDVIYRIERWRDSLYLTTSNGIYVLKGDRWTRFRVEPDINGKSVIISEQL
jgi:hypothetical protein